MITIEEIVIGGVYRGKSGLPRKVKKFTQSSMRGTKKVSSPFGADIEYIRIDQDRKEHKGGYCWCGTFANWAIERIDI